jgi:hypothetical protein
MAILSNSERPGALEVLRTFGEISIILGGLLLVATGLEAALD